MRKPYAVISGVKYNGLRPNDQASEEMQICILLILIGCNTLPAWQHSHVITRACTLMFHIDAGEIFHPCTLLLTEWRYFLMRYDTLTESIDQQVLRNVNNLILIIISIISLATQESLLLPQFLNKRR